jgi:hypothetical protein
MQKKRAPSVSTMSLSRLVILMRRWRFMVAWLLHEALSLILGEAKLTAERMETTAEVTLEKVADGFAITAVHVTLKGKVRARTRRNLKSLPARPRPAVRFPSC